MHMYKAAFSSLHHIQLLLHYHFIINAHITQYPNINKENIYYVFNLDVKQKGDS